MASVEVSKLSSQEVAELACTYAALILHDDEQDITGTYPTIQVTRSASWSQPQESSLSPTGLKSSPRLLKARTSVHFSTSEPPLLPLPLLPLLLRRRKRRKRRRRKPLHHPRRKRKRWTWATSSDDCLVT